MTTTPDTVAPVMTEEIARAKHLLLTFWTTPEHEKECRVLLSKMLDHITTLTRERDEARAKALEDAAQAVDDARAQTSNRVETIYLQRAADRIRALILSPKARGE